VAEKSLGRRRDFSLDKYLRGSLSVFTDDDKAKVTSQFNQLIRRVDYFRKSQRMKVSRRLTRIQVASGKQKVKFFLE